MGHGRLGIISGCGATIPEIQGILNFTYSQVSAAVDEKKKRVWEQTRGAWLSKYEGEGLKLLELGELNSAKTTYGDDLWGDATKRTLDGPSAAYLLARKNDQTQTADTFLGMVQDRRKTASVSSLPDFDCLVLIVLTPRPKLSRRFRQFHQLVPQERSLSTRRPNRPRHPSPETKKRRTLR